MTIHHIKCDIACFEAMERGDKPWEIRFDDRLYQVGDVLVLMCWDREKRQYVYPSMKSADVRMLRRRITWIMTGAKYGIEPGYVIMSTIRVRDLEAPVEATLPPAKPPPNESQGALFGDAGPAPAEAVGLAIDNATGHTNDTPDDEIPF